MTEQGHGERGAKMLPEDQRGAPSRYTVIPRTLIFLTRDERVLLLKGAPDKRLWAGKYNGLGGHVEAGESPYRAALREVREEAGLAPTHLELRAVVHVTLNPPPGVVLFVFTGEAPQGELRSSDEGTPEWVQLADLPSLPLVEDLHQLLPRVLGGGPLAYGEYHFTAEGLQIALE
jgi:8-oxo-dGTP diphosphatase